MIKFIVGLLVGGFVGTMWMAMACIVNDILTKESRKGCLWYNFYKTLGNLQTNITELSKNTTQKATTNGERIRAMSDEELAEQLYLLRLDALRIEGYEGFIETKDEVLDWLKEGVEE